MPDRHLDVVYPISEMFVAPQGEGKHAGTLMNFIRFAGCTVGKPFSEAEREHNHFPIYTERCTLYDGRAFPCDTDYRVKERLAVEEIMDKLDPYVPYVVLTGGEPLMRDVMPLVVELKNRRFQVHVETSGTIPVDMNNPLWRRLDWICVSPKKGFLDVYADNNIANEFKLLVDEDFDWEEVPKSIRRKDKKICISAINGEHELNNDNVKRCIALQRQFPLVRITIQMHKILGTR